MGEAVAVSVELRPSQASYGDLACGLGVQRSYFSSAADISDQGLRDGVQYGQWPCDPDWSWKANTSLG